MLAAPGAPGRPGHLSAASGVVRLGDRLYVVADDEPAVGGFDRERLWLAQRGNGRDGENALIELDLDEALAGLREQRAIGPSAIRGLSRHELGDVESVPLTFSDLCPLPDGRLLFAAVAEAGESTYHDGECLGAAASLAL